MAAPIPRYKVRLHQANGETSSRGGLAENQKFHDIRLQRAQQKSDLYIEDLPHLHLPSNISDRLFDHQRYGVNWMYHLHLAKTGGILGDDMGLGKTFQVVSLMVGLMLKREIQKVLIAAPVSVLPNWQREIETHLLPHVPATTHILNSDMAKRKRLSILSEVFFDNNHQIIISSHQMITNMIEDFTQGSWDYVILDEGHVIKNPSTKMFKAMKSLKTKHRLLLTGTPIQNKLEEFWAVVDWATEGRAFGTLSNFTKMIADPIAKGQHPNATEFQLIVANEARDLLTRATKPILLQRKKKEQPKETLQLPEKKELVLWISLSTQQRNIYEKYMYSTTYSRAFSRSTYPVEVITYLKSLCRHPVLLEVAERKRKTEDLDDLVHSLQTLTMNEETTPENNYEDYGVGHLFDAIARVPTAEELLRGSVKLRVLVKMITALTDEGHRILVFSQSKLMLQIIQYVLIAFDFASYKIDGSMNARERQQIIDDFNNISEDYSGPLVCLLTTKACGCGITLTAADRVIIFDPSWNPGEDRQSVDRCYRIGQTKPVIVYRLIQASCVEEKVYEKQVFKEGLRVVSEKGIATEKYFAGQVQLKELLDLGPAKETLILSKLPNQMELLDADKLTDVTGILGCTRHDELYKEGGEEEESKNHVEKVIAGKVSNSGKQQPVHNILDTATDRSSQQQRQQAPHKKLTASRSNSNSNANSNFNDENIPNYTSNNNSTAIGASTTAAVLVDLTGEDEKDKTIKISEKHLNTIRKYLHRPSSSSSSSAFHGEKDGVERLTVSKDVPSCIDLTQDDTVETSSESSCEPISRDALEDLIADFEVHHIDKEVAAPSLIAGDLEMVAAVENVSVESHESPSGIIRIAEHNEEQSDQDEREGAHALVHSCCKTPNDASFDDYSQKSAIEGASANGYDQMKTIDRGVVRLVHDGSDSYIRSEDYPVSSDRASTYDESGTHISMDESVLYAPLMLLEMKYLSQTQDHDPSESNQSLKQASPFASFTRPDLFSPVEDHSLTSNVSSSSPYNQASGCKQQLSPMPSQERFVLTYYSSSVTPNAPPQTPSTYSSIKIKVKSAAENGSPSTNRRTSFLNLSVSPTDSESSELWDPLGINSDLSPIQRKL